MGTIAHAVAAHLPGLPRAPSYVGQGAQHAVATAHPTQVPLDNKEDCRGAKMKPSRLPGGDNAINATENPGLPRYNSSDSSEEPWDASPRPMQGSTRPDASMGNPRLRVTWSPDEIRRTIDFSGPAAPNQLPGGPVPSRQLHPGDEPLSPSGSDDEINRFSDGDEPRQRLPPGMNRLQPMTGEDDPSPLGRNSSSSGGYQSQPQRMPRSGYPRQFPDDSNNDDSDVDSGDQPMPSQEDRPTVQPQPGNAVPGNRQAGGSHSGGPSERGQPNRRKDEEKRPMLPGDLLPADPAVAWPRSWSSESDDTVRSEEPLPRHAQLTPDAAKKKHPSPSLRTGTRRMERNPSPANGPMQTLFVPQNCGRRPEDTDDVSSDESLGSTIGEMPSLPLQNLEAAKETPQGRLQLKRAVRSLLDVQEKPGTSLGLMRVAFKSWRLISSMNGSSERRLEASRLLAQQRLDLAYLYSARNAQPPAEQPRLADRLWPRSHAKALQAAGFKKLGLVGRDPAGPFRYQEGSNASGVHGLGEDPPWGGRQGPSGAEPTSVRLDPSRTRPGPGFNQPDPCRGRDRRDIFAMMEALGQMRRNAVERAKGHAFRLWAGKHRLQKHAGHLQPPCSSSSDSDVETIWDERQTGPGGTAVSGRRHGRTPRPDQRGRATANSVAASGAAAQDSSSGSDEELVWQDRAGQSPRMMGRAGGNGHESSTSDEGGLGAETRPVRKRNAKLQSERRSRDRQGIERRVPIQTQDLGRDSSLVDLPRGVSAAATALLQQRDSVGGPGLRIRPACPDSSLRWSSRPEQWQRGVPTLASESPSAPRRGRVHRPGHDELARKAQAESALRNGARALRAWRAHTAGEAAARSWHRICEEAEAAFPRTAPVAREELKRLSVILGDMDDARLAGLLESLEPGERKMVVSQLRILEGSMPSGQGRVGPGTAARPPGGSH